LQHAQTRSRRRRRAIPLGSLVTGADLIMRAEVGSPAAGAFDVIVVGRVEPYRPRAARQRRPRHRCAEPELRRRPTMSLSRIHRGTATPLFRGGHVSQLRYHPEWTTGVGRPTADETATLRCRRHGGRQSPWLSLNAATGLRISAVAFFREPFGRHPRVPKGTIKYCPTVPNSALDRDRDTVEACRLVLGMRCRPI
jgi:hypothetical protein